MEDNSRIQEIFQKLIQSQYLKHYSDWHKTSNDKEKRGLKLIGLIIKNKGMVKLKMDASEIESTSTAIFKSNSIE